MAIMHVFFPFMALSLSVLWILLFLGSFVFDVAYFLSNVLFTKNYMFISLDNCGQWSF
jgi:hypothetical protein